MDVNFDPEFLEFCDFMKTKITALDLMPDAEKRITELAARFFEFKGLFVYASSVSKDIKEKEESEPDIYQTDNRIDLTVEQLIHTANEAQRLAALAQEYTDVMKTIAVILKPIAECEEEQSNE